MTETLEFRDRSNLEHIRENLFKGTEYGRAAVMIGAGFSRNAEKFSSQIPNFPLAADLGEILYSKIHPEYDRSKKTSEEIKRFGNNFDEYASEYSEKFGQGELYSLLIKSIPDEKYLPGELHELLLSLPWSDVFTTNYDTLLERTLPKIYNKKYDIIKTQTQIPLRSKPRIVKLHGDIPCNSFVITKEDYDNYEKDFAAFQNLVQQSILENVFCLIGFGGNDKNFIKWKEWVNKNLKSHSPPIYLCGILDLDEKERSDLEKKKIKIVDLGPIFPRDKFHDKNSRHKTAMEWLLKSLAIAKPNNKLSWPEQTYQDVLPIRNPLAPPLISRPSNLTISANMQYHRLTQSNNSTIIKDIENNLKIWTIERESYPGWIIAPKKNRMDIWVNTSDSINPILNNIDSFKFPTNLHLLFELVWRLEVCLCPLFSNVAECIESEIKKINPFSNLLTIDEAIITPEKVEYQTCNWNLIRSQWVDLAYFLTRHYRESNDFDKYQFWIDLLEKINVLSTIWKNKWYYEKSMFFIFRLDQENLIKQLSTWSIDDNHPEYLMKKAGLYAELGELENANTIAEHALNVIRFHLHSNRDDFYLLSLEGWCLFLLQSINSNIHLPQKRSEDYQGRWEQLAKYNCDPWIEIEKFKASVSIPKPRRPPAFEKKHAFDPGIITTTHHLSSEPDIVKILPAFAFLKMLDTVGLPIISGHVIRFNEEVTYAAEWIETYDPVWAIIMILRSDNEKVINNKFQRLSILRIDEKLFDNYYTLAITSLRQSLKSYYQNGHNRNFDNTLSFRQIKIQMELLSRLSVRLSDDRLGDLLDITIKIYEAQKNTPKFNFYEGLGNLFKRITYSASSNKLLERMGTLLSLPIPTENQFTVPILEHFPEPFEYIYFQSSFKIPEGYDRSSWDSSISYLIHVSKTGATDARRRSLMRLIRLFKINGLNKSEIEAFKDALWQKTDPNSHLPTDIGYLNFVLLGLPELSSGDVKNKYRNWLISQPIPQAISGKTGQDGKMHYTMNGGGGQLTHFIYEWLYSSKRLQIGNDDGDQNVIEWSESEILTLFNNISKLWEEQQNWLSDAKERNGYFYPYLREQFTNLLLLFEQIIIFKLDCITDQNEVKRILKTLNEFSKNDLCINSTIPGILLVRPEESIQINNQLRIGLFSSNSELAIKSIDGIYNYAILAHNGKVLSMEEKIISDFVYSIVLRKEPGLSHALDIASQLIRYYPDLFKEQHIDDLCLSVENSLSPIKTNLKEIDFRVREDEIQVSDIEVEAIQNNTIELVSSLQQYYNNKGKPLPESIKKFPINLNKSI